MNPSIPYAMLRPGREAEACALVVRLGFVAPEPEKEVNGIRFIPMKKIFDRHELWGCRER